MEIHLITAADFAEIENDLKPKEWPTIIPHLQYYLQSAQCYSIKLVQDKKIIAIGTTILHADTAWLGHIIVSQEHRNKGLGTTITKALIERVPTTYKTILLIATDLGEHVYKKLGFETETEYVAHKDVIITTEKAAEIIPFEEKYREQVYSLNTKAYNENRKTSLDAHIPKALVYVGNGTIDGFYMPTFGEGLIVAANPQAGIELQKYRLQTHTLCFFPQENMAMQQFFATHNFTEVRRMKKMFLGEKRNGEAAMIYNRIGGNFG